jgi:HD superfamily phosphodiesterase
MGIMENEKLTTESAEKFFKDSIKGMNSGFEKKFLIQHTKDVLKTSLNLAKIKKNKNLDINSLKIACWLHDIGRTIKIEGHAEISLRLTEENFSKDSINNVIKDCVLNHSSSKFPETEEGKIMQLADKLSILNDFKLFKLIFSKEKYKEESIKMVEYVSKDLIEVLKRYNWKG